MTIYIVQGRYRPHQSKLSEKYGTSKDKYIDQKRKILHLDVHTVSEDGNNHYNIKWNKVVAELRFFYEENF